MLALAVSMAIIPVLKIEWQVKGHIHFPGQNIGIFRVFKDLQLTLFTALRCTIAHYILLQSIYEQAYKMTLSALKVKVLYFL